MRNGKKILARFLALEPETTMARYKPFFV